MRRRKVKEKSDRQRDRPPNNGFVRFRGFFERYGAIPLVLLLVGVYAGVRMTASSDSQHAQLRFVENGKAKTFDGEGESEISFQEPLAGPAYETALRLREVGALGLAVSLSVFAKHAATQNIPADHQDIVREMTARKLMPPGIEIENGFLRSHLSELRFSYRSEPLSFEILSVSKDRAKGSALLLRFPLPTSGTNSVMYFESLAPTQLPSPFSTNEHLTAAGWKIGHWRGNALPLDDSIVRDLREHEAWLKSLNQGSK
jgi:hypothetical protein